MVLNLVLHQCPSAKLICPQISMTTRFGWQVWEMVGESRKGTCFTDDADGEISQLLDHTDVFGITQKNPTLVLRQEAD